MVHITHFVVSLFILAPPFEISGFTIHSESKLSPPPPPSTELPKNAVAKESSSSDPQSAHHVPLSRAGSLVKREVTLDEEKVNGLAYDPSMMVMSKRSAAALNKLMLALRSSLDESASNENELDASDKENRFSNAGFRSSGSGYGYDPFPSNALQRRGQKDRKVYLRCYFNAVSCFRKK